MAERKTAEFEPPTPMTGSPGRRVFPLHVTPFESYMLMDDRPEYPMTFIVQFEFSGKLNRNAFKESIDDALERHPLLRAVIRRAKLNRDCWVNSGKVRPLVHFGGLDEPLEFPGAGIERIDLHNETGLRIWVRHNESKAVLTTQFHHAMCDGMGAYHFLGDVLWSYATRTQKNKNIADAPELSISLLRNRGLASYNPANFLTDKGRFQSEIKHAAKMALGRNAPIRPTKSKRTESTRTYTFPGILSHEFDKNEYRQLRLAAQKYGQTINDLLLEKLFVTLNQREKLQRKWLGGRQICVMMPLDLREPDAEKTPACNIVTYAFIRRGGKLLEQPGNLRKSLREETLWLKHNRHRTNFMNLVVGSQQFPQLFKFALFRNHCLATAVLSNTGDPTRRFLVDFPRENGMIRCGNLCLTGISGVPPMRIKTRATISIFTYRRLLKICLRCDPHFFNVQDTQVLLDQYVDQVRKVLD